MNWPGPFSSPLGGPVNVASGAGGAVTGGEVVVVVVDGGDTTIVCCRFWACAGVSPSPNRIGVDDEPLIVNEHEESAAGHGVDPACWRVIPPALHVPGQLPPAPHRAVGPIVPPATERVTVEPLTGFCGLIENQIDCPAPSVGAPGGLVTSAPAGAPDARVNAAVRSTPTPRLERRSRRARRVAMPMADIFALARLVL